MKRIVASVGMVALGASSVQAAGDAISSPEPVKPWSVTATLRGFYDDNINSTPIKQHAWGYEVSPSALLKQDWEQTSLSLGYTYSFLYYDHQPAGNAEKYDQDHTFNGALTHRFSDRYALSLTDGFVIGQQPDMLRTGVIFNNFQRVPGENIRNAGAVNFDAQLTRLFGLQLGYANSFYHYAAHTAEAADNGDVIPSPAGLLNRIENAVHLDGRWLLQPQTVGVLGYQFRDIAYTGNEEIGGTFTFPEPNPAENVTSDSRNVRMHYAYVGLDHNFRPDLMGSVRVGATVSDYYNAPNPNTKVSPYAQISLRYTYAQESYLEAGFTYDRAATDVVGVQTNATGTVTSLTTDMQAAVAYATWNHRITPRLFGSLLGQFQNNQYNNGIFNDQTDQFYLLGLNLEYRFTRNFSAHVGYSFDKLVSNTTGLDRSFDRNRVYMGIAASY